MTGATRYVLGGVLTLVGSAGLVRTLARSQDQARTDLRSTRGPGWWIARLIAMLPGPGARFAFALLWVGIVALGVAELAGA